ncbi:MAG: hypothetical protein EBR51_13175, partial [Gammaproteobacteria bacterium]|nr:hypothetical protein [Gammaproteobacteria bacterium]
AFLGSSNVLATIGTSTAGTSYELGYVFKNVAAGIDATVSVGAGSATQNSDIGLNLRRSLSEVVAGLEIAVGVHIKVQKFQVSSLVPKGTFKSA